MSLKVKIFLGFSICVLLVFSVLSYYTFKELRNIIMVNILFTNWKVKTVLHQSQILLLQLLKRING